jgi:hypothetical protein
LWCAAGVGVEAESRVGLREGAGQLGRRDGGRGRGDAEGLVGKVEVLGSMLALVVFSSTHSSQSYARTHQLYQQAAIALLHQFAQLLLQTIFCLDGIKLAANMSLPCRGTSTLLCLCFSQIGLTLFLLRQRRGLSGVLLVLCPALSRELRRFGREQSLPETLNAQLSHEREAGGSEEHLLADGCAIGNVGHGCEAV